MSFARLGLAWALMAMALVTQAAAAEATASEATSTKPEIGTKIADVRFKDIHWLERSIKELGEKKAFVVVFTTLECPLVQRYLPRIKELSEQYKDKDVQFVAINVGPEDALTEVAYQAIKVDAQFPFGKDFSGETVKALGVERTPEVVVLDGELTLKYRGRINSQYRTGGVAPEAGREDLKEAIEDVLAGRELSVKETPVDGCKITFEELKSPIEKVNYSEHVAAIFQKNCQDCHRPGTTAPFSLLEYEDAVNYAEMIAEVVGERRMPPQYASSEHGHFINKMELTRDERAMVVQWCKTGCEQGDKSKAPAPREFPTTRWRIGEPDLVLPIPKAIKIPKEGYVAYKYVFLPHKFEQDTWVQAIEILPDNMRAVHHANLVSIKDGNLKNPDFITGYVPGGDPMVMGPNEGFCVRKGSTLVLQIHYVTYGEESTDQMEVGLVYCKQRVDKEIRDFQVTNLTFKVPPHEPHYRVDAVKEFNCDATGVGMFVHMHLRGKDMLFRAVYPDGTKEDLLMVPNYNFDWQLSYRWDFGSRKFPKGTKIECVAHYDNSKFNPYNPAPEKTVEEGQQTYQEMMYGFMFYTDDNEKLGLEIDPSTGFVLNGAAPADQASSK